MVPVMLFLIARVRGCGYSTRLDPLYSRKMLNFEHALPPGMRRRSAALTYMLCGWTIPLLRARDAALREDVEAPGHREGYLALISQTAFLITAALQYRSKQFGRKNRFLGSRNCET